MLPRITNYAYNILTVPQLSGGVNLKDGVSFIEDNQLSDCLNVWNKDGVLSTRPGINYVRENMQETSGNSGHQKLYSNPNIVKNVNGINYFLVATWGDITEPLCFWLYPESADKETKPQKMLEITELPNELFSNINVFSYGEDIYCFIGGCYEKNEYFIFRIYRSNGEWEYSRITNEDIYAPLVMINCKPWATMEPVPPDSEPTVQGDFFEGYNLLSTKYRMKFTSFDKSRYANTTIPVDEWNSPAQYELLHKVEKGQKIKATITTPIFNSESQSFEGIVTVTHEVDTSAVEIGENGYYWEIYDAENPPKDNLVMGVIGRMAVFYDISTQNVKIFTKDYYVSDNNVEITAECSNSKENYEKVLNMTFSDWYGGGSKGLYGGIHLFMGGNTNENEKSLVVWSDLNKPLYFGENSYAYVGDKSQKVTAFGKQGEALIIFKEREIYSTKYISDDDVVSAEQITQQSVVDITAAEATFPMLQVHGYIGCDCPNTVQLCRNRLVWLNSSGKVYTLVSANQYTERSIYEVSDMIETELLKNGREALKFALSADWEGHYVLSVGNKIYLMDYNSSGYSHAYSYLKEKSAQVNIPWWIWQIPKYTIKDTETPEIKQEIIPKALISIGNNLFIPFYLESDSYCIHKVLYFDGKTDNMPSLFDGQVSEKESLITSMFQTKFFDFGLPTVKKNVPKIEVLIGGNQGRPIIFKTITDTETDEENVVLTIDETNSLRAGYYQSTVIKPKNRMNYRIGLKCETDGEINVGAIILQFKRLGGMK
jgi:hypothetical protein